MDSAILDLRDRLWTKTGTDSKQKYVYNSCDKHNARKVKIAMGIYRQAITLFVCEVWIEKLAQRWHIFFFTDHVQILYEFNITGLYTLVRKS